MENFIVAGILLVIIGAAVVYIIKAKKSGVKCIGCPSGGSCHKGGNGESACTCGCKADASGK